MKAQDKKKERPYGFNAVYVKTVPLLKIVN